VWADLSGGITVNFRCPNEACPAGKAPWDTPEPGVDYEPSVCMNCGEDEHTAEELAECIDSVTNPWPGIERNVPVTPALRRRFVSRNWCFGYNGHSIYQLGTLPADLYAVTWDRDHNPVITGRIKGASTQSTADLIAFLSEWEG
jgi:hypothetical protein